jgi:hypothetical protein
VNSFLSFNNELRNEEYHTLSTNLQYSQVGIKATSSKIWDESKRSNILRLEHPVLHVVTVVMNVALSHPSGFFLNASTRVYIRDLIQHNVNCTLFDGNEVHGRGSVAPDAILLRKYCLRMREIGLRMYICLNKIAPDVSTKNIHTWGNFIHLQPRPLRGPSRRNVLTLPRRNHYYEIPPDVLST